MHVLILSPFFPPHYIGGAEVAACELGRWLVRRGHRVTVLTAAAEDAPEQPGAVEEGGIEVWRLRFHRPYSVAGHYRHGGFRKIQWHLQDQADPRNLSPVERVLDAARPDLVNVQGLQGLGHNIPLLLGARGLPVVYTLNDYAVACVKASLHSGGEPCAKLHPLCAAAKAWKWHCLDRVRRLSFYSPSAALYRELDRVMPGRMPQRREVIKYPMRFTVTDTERERPDCPHFLYVGRIQDVKGVGLLLAACRRLAATHRFRLTLVGKGPEEEALKAEYGAEPWVRFAGFVPNPEVGSFMRAADVLCTPSLWAEPFGLVIYQAAVMGLPVLASAIGGIPELVAEGKSGFLLPPGDGEAWYRALQGICDDPGKLTALKEGAREHARAFDQDLLGNRVLELFEWTAALPA